VPFFASQDEQWNRKYVQFHCVSWEKSFVYDVKKKNYWSRKIVPKSWEDIRKEMVCERSRY
jgi:hypothetical protein